LILDKTEVTAKAKDLYKKWKAMIERRVELTTQMQEGVGVDYDQETIRLRDKSLSLMRESLVSRGLSSPTMESEEQIRRTEVYIFENKSKKLLNTRYKRIVRKVVFALRHNQTFVSKFLSQKPSEIIEDLLGGKFDFN